MCKCLSCRMQNCHLVVREEELLFYLFIYLFKSCTLAELVCLKCGFSDSDQVRGDYQSSSSFNFINKLTRKGLGLKRTLVRGSFGSDSLWTKTDGGFSVACTKTHLFVVRSQTRASLLYITVNHIKHNPPTYHICFRNKL